ncbi:glycerol-3-phosphate responsive antiterminator [Mycoplasma sp. P36-A1]|uniref:glycerol-3-phosphate responsive antiterminator n=1 Tax=Mycoplasma sp. P36-A1 TaxID=3252900 RepID=UPI003C2DDA4B
MFNNGVIPAISNYKNLDLFLNTEHIYGVILDFHINHLSDIINKMHKNNKKVFVHIDMIHGLANDKYGTEYLCQKLKVDGIISTKPNALLAAKANNCLAIQRIFLIDSTSLKKSIDLVNKIQPDYLEVLPALASKIFTTIESQIDIPVIGGGLIVDKEDIKNCLDNGLVAVTTGKKSLWC